MVFGSTQSTTTTSTIGKKWEYLVETVVVEGIIRCIPPPGKPHNQKVRATIEYTVTKDVECKCGELPKTKASPSDRQSGGSAWRTVECAKETKGLNPQETSDKDAAKSGYPYLYKGYEKHRDHTGGGWPRHDPDTDTVKFKYIYGPLVTCITEMVAPCKNRKCHMETTIGPKEYNVQGSYEEWKTTWCNLLLRAKLAIARAAGLELPDYCSTISKIYDNFKISTIQQGLVPEQDMGTLSMDDDLLKDAKWQKELKNCKNKMPAWCLRTGDTVKPSSMAGKTDPIEWMKTNFFINRKSWLPHPDFVMDRGRNKETPACFNKGGNLLSDINKISDIFTPK